MLGFSPAVELLISSTVPKEIASKGTFPEPGASLPGMFRHFWLALALAACASAQVPRFDRSRVQIPNSAETTPLGPGELVSVYGSNLGPAQPCQGQADPDLRETPNPLRPDPG